ncbi:M20/M25/M40 family metallo-hydrolase [Sphingomonas arenae]|uniref:M20/M25/M40 family metallo-hydrolase n=1 Tax=Sphingomonas arenae TaxID=2812555 RepID=UPI0019686E79|nr:M20/M25/M40 family metallo-hydrolase [Sphingomonas arenae]
MADRVQADVEFLADDLLEGRGAGERGHEVAALYVASQFRSLGMQPAGENGSWYQRVPFRRATHEGSPRLELISGATREALSVGSDAAVRPSITERERRIEAPMVFVGWGITDGRYRFDDYRGLDLKGKIAVAFSGTPKGLPSEVAAHLSQQKDEFAAAAGAIGLIEIDPGSDSPAGTVRGASRPRVTDWVDAKGRTGNTAAGLRFRAGVSEATTQRMFAGAAQSLARIRAEAAGGRHPKGFALKPRFALQDKMKWEEFTSPAVLGLLPGTDPKLRSETVILMGHLDHLGIDPDAKPGEDAIYNGALDNAAGIATMLEAGRAFVRSGKPPKRSVLFIAHTAEELGLLGASYWASNPTVPLRQVAGAVNLDMPVPLYDFTEVVAFGADHSTVARAVADAAKTMGLGVGPDPMPEQGIFTRSDHYPLVMKGVPSVLLFTGHANGGKEVWARFFEEAYHQVDDDLKQPIRWTALARYGELNYRIARTLADAPQRPRWIKGSYFADLVAPGEPRAER